MASGTSLLRTRVARRILVLFTTSALVPVVVMGVLSFFAARRELESVSESRLRRLAANAAQSVAQQLFVAESGLRQAARLLTLGTAGAESLAGAVPPSIEALTLVADGGDLHRLKGDLRMVPALDSAGSAHLRSGKALVLASNPRGGLLAAVAVDPEKLRAGVLWARLVPDSIWGPADEFTALSSRADFCVLGAEDRPMYCNSGSFAVANAFRSARVRGGASGVLSDVVDGRSLFTGYRRLLLAPSFLLPTWTILVSESTQSVQAPLSSFSYSFPLALFLGFLFVFLLTNIQVRRTMEPLTALEEGTRRIAGGDLATRVEVTSRDEFSALAGSFNRMAGRLGLMFRQIETGRAIDQAVLTARSAAEAVTAILSHFDELVPSREVTVLLVEDQDAGSARVRTRTSGGREASGSVPFGVAEVEWMRQNPDHRIVSEFHPLLDALTQETDSRPPPTRVVLPFVARDEVFGALWYEPAANGAPDPAGNGAPDPEAVHRARQIADQATVALDELRLIGELEELNWGTLRALARAIDAKSRWTSGHSERVTELAVEVARELGFDERALDALNRGGLLHDIGKIGIPADILDLAGPLSADQRVVMRQHTTIGARILEPVRAFRPSLGIVSQHHEHWDGRGYPAGLAGEEIDPLARVLAVADSYDAMVSPRPYRDSIDPAEVARYIQERRGTDFEPVVVDAFMRVIARRGVEVPIHE